MHRYGIRVLMVLLLAAAMPAQEPDPHVKLYIPYEQYS
jgi:hypothetical protein